MKANYNKFNKFLIKFLKEYNIKDKDSFIKKIKGRKLYCSDDISPGPGDYAFPPHYIYLQGIKLNATVMISIGGDKKNKDISSDISVLEKLLNSEISLSKLGRIISRDKQIRTETKNGNLDLIYLNEGSEKTEFNRILLRV